MSSIKPKQSFECEVRHKKSNGDSHLDFLVCISKSHQGKPLGHPFLSAKQKVLNIAMVFYIWLRSDTKFWSARMYFIGTRIYPNKKRKHIKTRNVLLFVLSRSDYLMTKCNYKMVQRNEVIFCLDDSQL